MDELTNEELVEEINLQREIMIGVATGEIRIQDVNDEYKDRRYRIRRALKRRFMEDPNPFTDLWKWYGKWRDELPTYQDRREFVADMYDPLIESLIDGPTSYGVGIFEGLTGWDRVDRGILAMRNRLSTAVTPEEFQTVGLLCRETLISLAQSVYDPDVHEPPDGVDPSPTDAKRMIEGYISMELSGGPNEEARRFAKAALTLANALQHKRTATFKDAALCAEATTSLVNILAIISGKRTYSNLE